MTEPTPRQNRSDSERAARSDPAELGRRLAALRPHIQFPPTPDLATRVHAAIDRRAGSSVTSAPSRRWWPGWFPALGPATAIAALLLLAVATLAVPAARAVVAGWLDRADLPGVRIELIEEPSEFDQTTESSPAVGPTLLLGERVSLAEAAARAPFPLKMPAHDTLGAPDEVYLREIDGGALVSLLYLPRPDLPEIGTTGVGALLMQVQSAQPTELIVKGVVGEEGFMPVRIGASDGYWVRNGRLYLAPDPADPLMGDIGVSRPSGNVLLWTEAGITYRFETALDRVPAVAVVEALLPMATPSANEHDDITVGFGAAASVSRRSPSWGRASA